MASSTEIEQTILMSRRIAAFVIQESSDQSAGLGGAMIAVGLLALSIKMPKEMILEGMSMAIDAAADDLKIMEVRHHGEPN